MATETDYRLNDISKITPDVPTTSKGRVTIASSVSHHSASLFHGTQLIRFPQADIASRRRTYERTSSTELTNISTYFVVNFDWSVIYELAH